jgi:hypothetical protein
LLERYLVVADSPPLGREHEIADLLGSNSSIPGPQEVNFRWSFNRFQ